MIQLTINVKQFDIIKTTSFFANYGRDPNLFDYKESSMLTNVTKSRVKIMKQVHNNIVKMQKKSSTYLNKKKKNAPLLKKKNKILLLTKKLKRKKKSKKLNSIKIEAFFIKEIKEFKSYKLNLSKNVKVHSIFNISLLKLIDFSTLIQETFHYITQKKTILKRKD